LLCAVSTVRAGGFNDLLNQKDLTPETLARAFADFSFELGPRVQTPETFLQRKRGDCKDFANLASIVLNRRGYSTKLVVVMMSQQTHVVCYVKEAGGFLDFNYRADSHPVIASDGSLEDIASKVAGYFHSPWRMASAFRFRDGSPVYLDSVFPIESFPGKTVENRAASASRSMPAANSTAMNATVGTGAAQAVLN
jgi:hypothetical protein